MLKSLFKRHQEMKLSNPEIVTVSDCLLANQMGYEVEVNNGIVSRISKGRKKKKHLLKALRKKFFRLIPLYHSFISCQ